MAIDDNVTESASAGGGAVRVSPIARRLAQEHGLDLTRVRGTGPAGRILRRDVLSAVEGGASPTEAPAPAPAPPAATAPAPATEDVVLGPMRRTIARRLVESKATIPHFAVSADVAMDRLLAVRASVNDTLVRREGHKARLSITDFIVRATALALPGHRGLNASWADDAIRLHGDVNIGVAVSLPHERGGGLVVPTIRNAPAKDLRSLSREMRSLAAKARGPGLSHDEMSGGTFTITNLGMHGVERFEAIINPPEAAILAVGAVLEKPVVRDGRVEVGHTMTCTVSCDHRIVDGDMAAAFLQTLKRSLESPAALLL